MPTSLSYFASGLSTGLIIYFIRAGRPVLAIICLFAALANFVIAHEGTKKDE